MSIWASSLNGACFPAASQQYKTPALPAENDQRVYFPCRVLMSAGQWAPDVSEELKAKYTEPIDCPNPKPKREIAFQYIPNPIRRVGRPRIHPRKQTTGMSRAEYANRLSHITPEAIAQMRQAGMKDREIAAHFGCTRSLLSKRAPVGQRHDLETVVPELRKQGLTWPQVAERTGMNLRTVQRYR